MPDIAPALIPAPAFLELRKGSFLLQEGASISAPREFQGVARLFADETGMILVEDPHRAEADLVFEVESSPLPPGSYALDVSRAGVVIRARGEAGAFHATRTLRQLLLDGPALPGLRIEDHPRFGWRGLLLDSARRFVPVPSIKRLIDLLALFKMNRLHWHLTDDQAWRLEIHGRPLLTELGAPDGFFYTQIEVRRLVAYAAERHVEIVPEIEAPGHSLAALAAYPELSCTGGPFAVAAERGVYEDVLCAGDDAVFEFLEEVWDETLALFPSTYVHFGGAQCPRTRWAECPRCRARVRKEGVGDVEGLQSWFMWRVGQHLAERGRRVIGWDEIADGGMPPKSVVQSWRGFAGAETAVRKGHDAIVSPREVAFLHRPDSQIGLESVYAFEPVPKGLSGAAASRILGGEACLWATTPWPENPDTLLFPRLPAMAERLWSPVGRRDFDEFRRRVEALAWRLGDMGVAFGPTSG